MPEAAEYYSRAGIVPLGGQIIYRAYENRSFLYLEFVLLSSETSSTIASLDGLPVRSREPIRSIAENAKQQINRHQHWLILPSTTTTDLPSLPLGPSRPSTPQEHAKYPMHVQQRAARREPPFTLRVVGRRSNELGRKEGERQQGETLERETRPARSVPTTTLSPPPPKAILAFRAHKAPVASRAAARLLLLLRHKCSRLQQRLRRYSFARVRRTGWRRGSDIRCLLSLDPSHTPFLTFAFADRRRHSSTTPPPSSGTTSPSLDTHLPAPSAPSAYSPTPQAVTNREERTRMRRRSCLLALWPPHHLSPPTAPPGDVSQPAVHITRGLRCQGDDISDGMKWSRGCSNGQLLQPHCYSSR
ncbi:hypothetical protein GALMADRAFT_132784 [Galerina marginata CBS 339.88]|uniref:Uncharacterized protein n=1 Tax=Galerina marginata (strain CBS 339.88) TaxID=685588 RepID=A0A067TJA9_GALM3|nr:hypothetical protein GALMADRAFT_132784 [Galerina marginata CBS 339.88]